MSTVLVPLLVMISDVCWSARELIAGLKREAQALNNNAPMSESLLVVKQQFDNEYTQLLQHIQNLQRPLNADENRAMQGLRKLLADMETACLDGLIAAYPEHADYYHERAVVLQRLGRDQAAQQDYQQAMQLDPVHLPTLIDYGDFLMDIGFYTAARQLFQQAVDAHPQQAHAHLNLADVALVLVDLHTAKQHYQQALQCLPDWYAAHQGLALALAGLGEAEAAERHRELGFRGRASLSWPYRGVGKAEPVLVLSSAYGGNIPFRHLLDQRLFHATVLLCEYTAIDTPLPAHRFVLNLIGDADLCASGLQMAQRLLQNTRMPVLNPPEKIMHTGRQAIAQRLGKLPGVRTPRMYLLTRAELANIRLEALDMQFPLLLRSPGFHTGLHFSYVADPADWDAAVQNLPGEALLLMEFLDSRNPQGKYCKYRVMIVAGKLYPLHRAISSHWKVHYFSADMAKQPAYRALEADFLQNMSKVLGEKAMAALHSIATELDLDYVGVDFGLDADGNLLVYEANATMAVHLPDADPIWDYRRPATETIQQAVRQLFLR